MSDDPHIAYFNMGQWPLYVGCTIRPSAFRKEMKRLGIAPCPDFLTTGHANATTHFLRTEGNLTAIVAMVKPGRHSHEQVAGLIAHEAVHVAQELWDDIGEDEPGKEAEAYLVQMIVQCCLQEVYKTGRTRKTEP